MRKLLIALLLACVTMLPACAQQPKDQLLSGPPAGPGLLMQKELRVREMLIKKYVGHYVWGVSLCGGDDYQGMTLYPDWITVYVFSDAPRSVLRSIPRSVDGIPIVIERKQRGK